MAFGGFVTLKPLYNVPKYGKLELGGGYYRQQNAQTITATRYESQTVSAALNYKYKKIGLKNEWAYRHGYGAIAANGDVPDAKGLFSQVTYDLTKKVQLLAKYDVFNPINKQNCNTEYTIGTNYFLADNNIKFQSRWSCCK